jgi:RNA polymerase sigma-70 factor (ECF subfamily)
MTISLQNIGATHLATSSVRLEETNSSSTLPQNMTDDALITRCIANDRLAQRALYDRYTNRLYSVAMRYVRHAETAQDVLAEAWIKIFKNLSKFKHDGSFEGWMKRIVSNEALMYLRKNRIDTAELSVAVIAQEPSEVRVTDGLESADVLRLLDTLPDGCRTVFNLFELEGFKHREIAEKLGVSINTSKSQLILAKQKLRQAYQVLSQREGRNLRPTPKQTKS